MTIKVNEETASVCQKATKGLFEGYCVKPLGHDGFCSPKPTALSHSSVVVEKDIQLSVAQEKLNRSVMYALKEGCFFPVPQPRKGASVRELIQWGAMRNLHDAIAQFNRLVQPSTSDVFSNPERGAIAGDQTESVSSSSISSTLAEERRIWNQALEVGKSNMKAAIVKRVPQAAEKIARKINQTEYPKPLSNLLNDCSIANERVFADWLAQIITTELEAVEGDQP